MQSVLLVDFQTTLTKTLGLLSKCFFVLEIHISLKLALLCQKRGAVHVACGSSDHSSTDTGVAQQMLLCEDPHQICLTVA